MSSKGDLAPLESILNDILNRVKAIEGKIESGGSVPSFVGKEDSKCKILLTQL